MKDADGGPNRRFIGTRTRCLSLRGHIQYMVLCCGCVLVDVHGELKLDGGKHGQAERRRPAKVGGSAAGALIGST